MVGLAPPLRGSAAVETADTLSSSNGRNWLSRTADAGSNPTRVEPTG